LTLSRFDESAKTVFVGDYSGTITVLKLEDTECKFVSTLKGHTGECIADFIYLFCV